MHWTRVWNCKAVSGGHALCRRQEVPFSRKGCDVASKSMPILSMLDTARVVRSRHAQILQCHGMRLKLSIHYHALSCVISRSIAASPLITEHSVDDSEVQQAI